jgi:pyrroloquinoline quinone biosynthesis protein D
MHDAILKKVYAIAPGKRLQWEPAQESHVLLYPEGMVKLNPSAAEIMRLVDGERNIEQIVAELQNKFGMVDSIQDDVLEFFTHATQQNWVCDG